MTPDEFLKPIADATAGLRSSPENVAVIAGAGILLITFNGPERTAGLLGGLSLAALALALRRHATRTVGDEKPNPIVMERHGSQIQTLIFSKHTFTQGQAVTWAKKHGFVVKKVDVEAATYRIRQRDPREFTQMRTIKLANGVQAVVGFHD